MIDGITQDMLQRTCDLFEHDLVERNVSSLEEEFNLLAAAIGHHSHGPLQHRRQSGERDHPHPGESILDVSNQALLADGQAVEVAK